MKFFGKIISIFAFLALKGAWHELKDNLYSVYNKYKISCKHQISPELITMLIVAEDHRFNRHCGVDFVAIGRVFWCFIFHKKLSGGSTIEQQLVRTLTGRYERTLRRKIKEIFLASLVHKVIPKSDLPGVYLFIAYFGWKMNGLQQATQRLEINIGQTSLRQAASIVSRLKYPEPKVLSTRRNRQILIRTEYLMRLRRQISKQLIQKEVEITNATVRDY